MSITLLLAVVLFVPAPAPAPAALVARPQEPASPADARGAATPADVTAVKAAFKSALASSVVFLATIGQERHENPLGGNDLPMSTEGNEFSGNMEVELTKEGEFLAVAPSLLPEIVVYDSGKRRLTRMIVEGKPLNVEHLSTDLAVLRDASRVLAAFDKGATCRETSAGRTISCDLPPDVFPQPTGIEALARPRVKAAALSVNLNRDGTLASVQLRVTRSDPNAAMLAQAMSGIAADRRQGVTIVSSQVTVDDIDQDAGAMMREYELKVQPGPASQRAQDLLQSLRKLATME